MANHYFDAEAYRTRCGDYIGEVARSVSANGRVSCPDCLALLTPRERADEFYLRGDDE